MADQPGFQLRWFKIRHRFEGNDGSIVWAGQLSVPPGFEMDSPWYHCPTCLDSDSTERRIMQARLSIGASFCSGCGARLDWEHTSRFDQDDVVALVAEIERETGLRVEVGRG